MPIFVSAVLRPAVFTRWLHLAMGGVFAGMCVMVAPGFDESLSRTLIACLISPLPVLALTALVPATRHAEGVQARWLLRPSESSAISLSPSRARSDRVRTGLWLFFRVWLGVAVLALTVNSVLLAGQLALAPFRPEPLQVNGIRVLAGDGLLLGPFLVPPLILALLGAVAAAGVFQTRAARALLGPSAAERLAEVEHRAEQLLERNRLAAELHDSIGHALTLTILQAGAARGLAATDPEFVHRALAVIEDTGRRALGDLERTLAVLRDAQDGPRARPTLAELDTLLDNARTAGTPILADISPRIGGVPGVVSREAYRILQEAVTNVLRHAPGGPVTIDVTVDDVYLELRVVSLLPARSAGPPRQGGKGLRGARERAILLGGDFSAKPQGDNWILEARLPLSLGFNVQAVRRDGASPSSSPGGGAGCAPPIDLTY
ncbi:histidine kinase [Frankia sp. R43]|uniref:sensor histidine kinase n=1 Tax=Frankia sp. R43 TaxID=269536 RepID=UPI0006CA1723|nr:histidine kinase [Frankia sp. R43]KPM53397.1 histidine kinase [Frankia sp. R43]